MCQYMSFAGGLFASAKGGNPSYEQLWCWNEGDEKQLSHKSVQSTETERKVSDVADPIKKEHGQNMFHRGMGQSGQQQFLDQELHLFCLEICNGTAVSKRKLIRD